MLDDLRFALLTTNFILFLASYVDRNKRPSNKLYIEWTKLMENLIEFVTNSTREREIREKI